MVLVGCAFVKPYLAVLLATLKVFLEITILAASYLRKRPGERILPLLLFVANRVLAVCIPVIGIIYLSGSAISASKLLSAEEWSIVGLLAFHLLVTLVRLPRIAEWFVTAWPRTASSKSDVQELLGLEADSAGHPAGGWHQFQTVDREMIKRRLRTSPHTNFVVECAGHGIVKSVYARNVSCDDIERWLASDTHFTAKELNHDGMFGAPDAPAHGDDALFVIGLQVRPCAKAFHNGDRLAIPLMPCNAI